MLTTVYKLFLVVLINSQSSPAGALNILGVFPYAGRSHFFVFEKLLEKLAERGHNLTVISHFPRLAATANYHDVSLAGRARVVESEFEMDRSVRSVMRVMDYATSVGNNDCKVMVENEAVQEIVRSRRKFDLVVVERFVSECGLGLAYKLGVPTVGLTSADLLPWHYRAFGVPFNPASFSAVFTGAFKPTLYERVETTLLDCWFCYKYTNAQKIDQKTLEKHFGEMPPLQQLSRETKFLLLYRNFVLSGSKLLPARVIEVGGYHLVPPKPLPEDLLKFIDEAEHGVIYFSFGSMLKESSLPKQTLDVIVNVLRSLPQRVIWKWNGEDTIGDPKKNYVAKWLPQNDVLAHPNVLAFFSHCGLLSTTEAIFHGVPLVVMPVYEDQILNAIGVVSSGLGVQVDLYNLTKEILMSKFKTVLDPRNNVKRLSEAYSDRPVSAMEKAIFWTEFAAKYNLTLSNYSSEVPQYQNICLNVVIVFGLIAVIALLVVGKILLVMLSVVWRLRSVRVKVKST